MNNRLACIVIALLCLSTLSHAQGLDMERQLHNRQSTKKTHEDTDADRHGTLDAWYLTPRTGDSMPAEIDTIRLNSFHRSYVEGLSTIGAYRGTQAGPYLSMDYFDRPVDFWDEFFFTKPYGHLINTGEKIRFFDSKVPYSYLKYLTSGTGDNQEQNFSALLTSNLGPNINVGLQVDLDHAEGIYNWTAAKNTTYRVFASYTKNRYEIMASVGNSNVMNQENGGITDMRYVTNPDDFQEGRRNLLPKDIPTKYQNMWNRIIYGEGRLHHRYRLGYYQELDEDGNVLEKEVKKTRIPEHKEPDTAPADTVPLSELPPETALPDSLLTSNSTDSIANDNSPMLRRRTAAKSTRKKEDAEEDEAAEPRRRFVPVTSIFHDFSYQKGERYFVSQDPNLLKEYPNPILPRVEGQRYYPYDYFSSLTISNTIGVELMEGFHKWAKMGIAAFVAFDYERYRQPLISREDAERQKLDYEELAADEHTTYVGGRVSSDSFKHLKYYVWGQLGLEGNQIGEIDVNGYVQTDFKLFGKEVTLRGEGAFLNTIPAPILRRFKATLHEWDYSPNPIQTIRLGGTLDLPFTGTNVRANVEMVQDPIRVTATGIPEQKAANIRVVGVGLRQHLEWKALNLDADVLWQTSSDHEVVPLPMLAVYGNLYAKVMVAQVMTLQLGVDAKWNTRYHAPYYEPTTQLFRPQDEVEIGGEAPLLTVYANAHLKRARFFAKYYNVGALVFKPANFTMPYYPSYPPMLQLGVVVDLRN